MKKTIISAAVLFSAILVGCGSSSNEDNTPEIVEPVAKTETKSATLESYLWSFDAGSPIRSTAALSDKTAFFATDTGTIYALSTTDGAESWQRNIGSKVSGNIIFAENTVLFLSKDGVFHALNAENGDTLWSVATAGESLVDQWDYHTNSPFYLDGMLYLASKSGVISALNVSDGSEAWSYTLDEKLRGTPLVIDNTLYVSSETGIYSINTTDGSENWHVFNYMPSSPAIDSGVLVVGSRSGLITGYTASTGAVLWTRSHGTSWVSGEPLAYNGNFYIGSSDDTRFESLNAETGEVNWSVSSGKNVFSKPAIVDDIVYMTSGDAYSSPGEGYIKALTLSGEILWMYTGSNFLSSPVVKDTTLFLGSDDGFFYAISVTQE